MTVSAQRPEQEMLGRECEKEADYIDELGSQRERGKGKEDESECRDGERVASEGWTTCKLNAEHVSRCKGGRHHL